MGRIAVIAFAFVAGLLSTGCHKGDPQQKAAAATPVASSTPGIIIGGGNTGKVVTDSNAPVKITARDLGAITLTNHFETCVRLGPGKDCLVTPVMIDGKTVQLTFTLESKKPNGKIHDLSITQVVARPGKPFEVALGGYNFSLTPNIIAE